MSKYCPIINGKVVYLECLECEEKKCRDTNAKNTNSFNKDNNNNKKASK